MEKPSIGKINPDHKFLKDNEYIEQGYRLYFKSTPKILRSLFMMHNESVNVWSHLIGVFLFFTLSVYCAVWITSHSTDLQMHFARQYYNLSQRAIEYSDRLNLSVEDLLHHAKDYETVFENTFVNLYSEAAAYEQAMADAISNLYQELGELSRFNLTEKYRVAEYKLKDLSKEIVQRIDSKEYDWIDVYGGNNSDTEFYHVSRWPLFVFMCSAMVCLTMSSMYHLFNAHSKTVNRFMTKLDYAVHFAQVGVLYIMMGASYIIGVLFYVNRIPECFFPGKFDFWGNSHNIWHMFVLLGAIFHYIGSIEAYHIRQRLPC